MGGSFFSQHGPHRQATPPSHGFARVHCALGLAGAPIIESVAHPDQDRSEGGFEGFDRTPLNT